MSPSSRKQKKIGINLGEKLLFKLFYSLPQTSKINVFTVIYWSTKKVEVILEEELLGQQNLALYIGIVIFMSLQLPSLQV